MSTSTIQHLNLPSSFSSFCFGVRSTAPQSRLSKHFASLSNLLQCSSISVFLSPPSLLANEGILLKLNAKTLPLTCISCCDITHPWPTSFFPTSFLRKFFGVTSGCPQNVASRRQFSWNLRSINANFACFCVDCSDPILLDLLALVPSTTALDHMVVAYGPRT